jgi:hypothetical protein
MGVQRDNFLPGHLGCDVRLYGGGNVLLLPPDQEDEHVCSKAPTNKHFLDGLAA